MEQLETHYDPHMGFYFSCPHCQQKYVSAECVQEHSTNCHMKSPPLIVPKIKSYSSLNPQALDMNFDSEGFPIRLEIIKKEPQDYIEVDTVDWQEDETDDSNLSNPADITEARDDAPSLRKLPPRLTQQKAKALLDSDDDSGEDSSSTISSEHSPSAYKARRRLSKILRDSLENPNSTCTEDRYLCRYCPRTFPFPSFARKHEECHVLKPKYSCRTCGVSYRRLASLVLHKKSHKGDPGFRCCYPRCPQTFKSSTTRWIHHKTHPKGPWNARGRRPGWYLEQNQTSTIPPALTSENENFNDEESIETLSMPDLSIEEPMAHSEAKCTKKITGPSKVIAKEIIPNASTTRQPSQSPPKIQLHDQKILQRSKAGETAVRQKFFEKKTNKTSSMQLNENNSDKEKVTAHAESVPDFPFVRVHGNKYFWCDFPDCGVVLTNLEARYLHHKKHEMSSKETTTIAQKSVGSDSKKRKVPQKEPKLLLVSSPKIVTKKNEGKALHSNHSEIPEFSMQNDEDMPAPIMQVEAVVRDQDFEADMQNQSMDTLQFINTDDDVMMSLFSEEFIAENIEKSESGLGSELSSTQGSSSASNPALRKISSPTSTNDKYDGRNISSPTSTNEKDDGQHPAVVKERKPIGRRPFYKSIQIGSKELFCCNFPTCGGVFNSRKVLYLHVNRHRMGKNVKSQLKLTENGMVYDSVRGCYLTG